MDLLYSVHQSLQCMLIFFNQGESQAVVVVSACSSDSVEVDIEVNISLFFGVFGWSYIDDKAGVSDIDTPSNDVGS